MFVHNCDICPSHNKGIIIFIYVRFSAAYSTQIHNSERNPLLWEKEVETDSFAHKAKA